MAKLRTFPTPASVESPLLGSAATMDSIDVLLQSDRGRAATRMWASKVREGFVKQKLDAVLGSSPRLPRGVLAASEGDEDHDTDVVVALIRGRDVWRGEWVKLTEPLTAATIPLDTHEVAFFIDAIQSGADGLALRAATPLAWLNGVTAAAGDDGLPEGSRVVALVDELDRNAVLELVAILPGPKVWRRHDGKWIDDPSWLSVLRSVKPPPIVVLEPDQIAGVEAQVDEATAGQEFIPHAMKASVDPYEKRANEMALEWALLSMTAASKTGPTGQMPAHLKKYWVYGKGAAKIRWGSPGAMRRCARQLRKYVGPGREYATCNNISKLIGGKGVAWDVG